MVTNVHSSSVSNGVKIVHVDVSTFSLSPSQILIPRASAGSGDIGVVQASSARILVIIVAPDEVGEQAEGGAFTVGAL